MNRKTTTVPYQLRERIFRFDQTRHFTCVLVRFVFLLLTTCSSPLSLQLGQNWIFVESVHSSERFTFSLIVTYEMSANGLSTQITLKVTNMLL